MARRLNPATSGDILKNRILCVKSVNSIITCQLKLIVPSVWKPLRGPVRDWPLALCDPTTVALEDAHPGDLVYDDYVVENCQLHYAKDQQWYFLSDQRPDEAWAFIQTDSSTAQTRVGVPHSSFPMPPTEQGGLPRESIEIRCLVYFNCS